MSTPVVNFGEVTVSTGYNASDVTIVLTTGHGSRLPSTFPFPLSWWDSTLYASPAKDPNREIVICTNRSGDTLTVTRAGEGTSASVKNTASHTYLMAATLTAGMVGELQSLALSQDFRGLRLQTHPDSDKSASQVRLIHADAIVMSDGQEVDTWDDLDADLTGSGLGGIDTGSEAASVWYEIRALWNGTLKKLQFHRAKDYLLDQTYTTPDDGAYILRRATGNANTKLSQGFKVAVAGPVEFVDVKLVRTGAVVGNIWFTIEATSGGVPSGTPLATSDKLDASRILTTAIFLRVPFRAPASLSAATQYHLVLNGDYTLSDTVCISWRADLTGATYANGNAAWANATPTWTNDAGNDFLFKLYVTENNVTYTPPTGYTHALIGYCYNDASSNLKNFRANNRIVACGADPDWLLGTFGAATALVDLFAFVPPIPVTVIFTTYQITASSGSVYADLASTDATCGATPGRGAVMIVVSLGSWDSTPPVGLGPYQGLMLDVAAASAKPNLASFIW